MWWELDQRDTTPTDAALLNNALRAQPWDDMAVISQNDIIDVGGRRWWMRGRC
jgi:hypothetical protein